MGLQKMEPCAACNAEQDRIDAIRAQTLKDDIEDISLMQDVADGKRQLKWQKTKMSLMDELAQITCRGSARE